EVPGRYAIELDFPQLVVRAAAPCREMPAPAAGVAGLDQPLAGQLALHGDEIPPVLRVVIVERDETRQILPEERIGPTRGARRNLDAIGKRTRQRGSERQAVVVGRYKRRRLREPGLEVAGDDEGNRVDGGPAANHGLVVELVRKTDARLNVVLRRNPEAGIGVRGKLESAADLECAGRDLGYRPRRVGCLGGCFDARRRVRIEATHVSVL